MVEIKAKLIHLEENVIETNLMPITITIIEDVVIVKAENGAVVSMGLDAVNLTLLAWRNDDGQHDPDLVLPVSLEHEVSSELDKLIETGILL